MSDVLTAAKRGLNWPIDVKFNSPRWAAMGLDLNGAFFIVAVSHGTQSGFDVIEWSSCNTSLCCSASMR